VRKDLEKYYKSNMSLEETNKLFEKIELISVKRKLLRDYGDKTSYQNIISIVFNEGKRIKTIEFSTIKLNSFVLVEARKIYTLNYIEPDNGEPAMYPNEWLGLIIENFFYNRMIENNQEKMKQFHKK